MRSSHGATLVGKHLVAAAVATVVDFVTMVSLVETRVLGAPAATGVGAAAGAATNFLIGRTWTFEATAAPAGPQMARYLVVSAASLGWNVAGEWLLASVLHVQYVAARVLVAVLVSLLWNFPMQRHFVFGTAGR